ncbi:MAG: Selenocysteine-specific elongation factor [Firmicutes bacterium]|nr:Selenocysteine-specific elongation factor [candidate division NPL-UPA2 bacterium]MBT9153947.1 Selenocysteine-specific elongation factor [candidate division NPL-UPA2 bacterium]
MKHLIVGTAGHIDHGKTTLIKALTGIDCDRLKEEKERGITIDLGFAYFDLPSGRRAGIVDVPGHERFIKNMLAGVGGMDLVLLAVAADEGVMPQTVEHLHILSLLQVKRGIVVITKADLVEPDWLDLVVLDIEEKVRGSVMADAPMIAVSAHTGQGLQELTAAIDRVCEDLLERDAHLPFRLPIDRVFTLQGFGTVVTGTLLSGYVRAGDQVLLYPEEQPLRVRGVGVHGVQVGTAQAGQRVALNLAAVSVEAIRRGDVLAAKGHLSPSMMLDVRLSLLPDVDKLMANRARVRLYIGTAEVICRAVLLDRDELLPGESAYAQLRLEAPVGVLAGDRFVLRSYSPLVTLGGGTVLDPLPKKRKRFRERGLVELAVLESGSTEEIISQYLMEQGEHLYTREQVLRVSTKQDREEALEQLLAGDHVVSVYADEEEYLFHRTRLKALLDKIIAVVSEYHHRFPLRSGMPREELRSRVFGAASSRVFAAVLLELQAESLSLTAKTAALRDFRVEFAGKWSRARDTAIRLCLEKRFSPPAVDELRTETRLSPEDTKELLEALVETQEIVKVADGMYFHASAVTRALELLIQHFRTEPELSLAAFRTYIDSSRKYALPLLEYFDHQRITYRVGEARKLHAAFDNRDPSMID